MKLFRRLPRFKSVMNSRNRPKSHNIKKTVYILQHAYYNNSHIFPTSRMAKQKQLKLIPRYKKFYLITQGLNIHNLLHLISLMCLALGPHKTECYRFEDHL